MKKLSLFLLITSIFCLLNGSELSVSNPQECTATGVCNFQMNIGENVFITPFDMISVDTEVNNFEQTVLGCYFDGLCKVKDNTVLFSEKFPLNDDATDYTITVMIDPLFASATTAELNITIGTPEEICEV